MQPEFLRQQDLLIPGQLRDENIDIVGAGSLGGAILLALCKMGCGIENRVTVTDFDTCKIHNLPTQWFRSSHAKTNWPKVHALAEAVELLCERRIETQLGRFSGAEERPLGPVLILAVDSIEERTRIWKNVKVRSDVRFLLDARMGAEVVEIRAVVLGRDAHDVYEESLHDPAQSFAEPCTRRAIVYTSLGAAGFVASLFRSYARGLPFPRYVAFDFRNFFLETSPLPAVPRAAGRPRPRRRPSKENPARAGSSA